MRIHKGIDGLKEIIPGSILSVGNFDGIHLGHLKLVEMARELRQRDGGPIVVVTFEPHPLTVLRPEAAPPRLTPPAVKQALLAEMAVDDYVILPPTREVLGLSAQDFFAILRDEVQPRHMIEGHSFNFGKGRGGNIQRLKEWSTGTQIELHVLEPVSVALLDLQVVDVSSSLIRWLLAHGRARDAAICLGRAYALHGTVIKGFGRGKQLGVPTANLACDDQLLPGDGVYAARCTVHGRTFPAALSIGTLPTFDQVKRQVEAHLIGFDGDLYYSQLQVQVVDWLREQRKFGSIEALKSQIQIDIARTLSLQKLDPTRPIARAG
jgi:riboflavin kinase / FMN adenylyltransferase